MLKTKIGEDLYGIGNIYAPSARDCPEFFDEVFHQMATFNCDYWVLGGDFNLVLDASLDRVNGATYKPLATQKVHEGLVNFELVDIWREKYPEDRKYTWFRNQDFTSGSRIDMFLVTDCLRNKTDKVDIKPMILTDHSICTLDLDLSTTKRGPGLWKFNNTLLEDEVFCSKVKEIILGVQRVHSHNDPSELWELLKFEIKNYSQEYSRVKNKNECTYRCNLYKILEQLQDEGLSAGGMKCSTLQ